MDAELILEAYKVVSYLNDILWGESEYIGDFLEVRATGYSISIYFASYRMWRSDDDYREFDEDKNEYEPLEGFIRREFNEHISRLSKMKL